MDALWILIAFVFGFVARQIGLPPLVGFLAAGFLLNRLNIEGGEAIENVADWGVYLLLFSIGLKLQIRSLLRPQIWAVATMHMGTTVIILSAAIAGLGVLGVGIFAGMDLTLTLLIAFALSFSSTVFAIKVFEDKGEMHNLHSQLSIGILIVQDVFAIVFMTLSAGKIPSAWAVLLLALPLLRPVLHGLMNRCGHGELLILLGLLFALGSADLFEAVKLKPDLGPLLFGVLVGQHPKSSELAKTLLGFKDLFLTGFFLSIGLSGSPTWSAVGIAGLLVLAVPLKAALFFWLLARFKMRARTATLTSFSLANYSEFGLIVCAAGVSAGWIGGEWLVIMAIAVSMTFVLASPLNAAAHAIYGRFESHLRPFERAERVADEEPIDLGDARIVVMGMGRVGTGAYDYLHERYGDCVLGIDAEGCTVQRQCSAGRTVIEGDATDSDLWLRITGGKVQIVMLAMTDHAANLDVVRRLKDSAYKGVVAASAKYDDELQELRDVGVDTAFNFYEEAGVGFAESVANKFGDTLERSESPGA